MFHRSYPIWITPRVRQSPVGRAKWILVHSMPRLIKPWSDPSGRKQLARLLDTLPPGRRRVAAALITDDCAPTYRAVAARLALSLLHSHLKHFIKRAADDEDFRFQYRLLTR